MASDSNATAAKPAKATAPRKPRTAPSHPPYLEMIGEAISTLKERTGSSQYAIGKFIEDKHKNKLPPNFHKVLLVQLRKFTASGKLTKIKNSYKLPSASKTATAAAAPQKPNVVAKPRTKAAAAAKPKPKPKPKATAGKKVATPKKKVASGLKKRKSVKSIGKSPVKKAPVKKAKK
ncbi:hypothetical protein J5N97_010659 [Dioscorea zingiberensis]|uniref:H15 domain-containing protein n=1 Tax=Dioscorea zingiberensis TaxID=325984 RepID=A0A9D5D0L7_9LILI|nr:hypothetical protein J5N97_010659 [Dioscorea zingiberensis]